VSSTRTLTTFLGWCTVINFSLLILAGLVWMILKDGVAGFGAPMFGVTEAELKVTFMRVLLQYRAGIVLFNLVPWIALKIMAGTAAPRQWATTEQRLVVGSSARVAKIPGRAFSSTAAAVIVHT
jgi:hypothetical protein